MHSYHEDKCRDGVPSRPAYRTSLAALRYESGFDEVIREELIARLHEAVTHREWP